MTTVTKLKQALEILEKHGKGDDFIEAGRDMVFLSTEPKDSPFADELMAAGASYSAESGWYMWV